MGRGGGKQETYEISKGVGTRRTSHEDHKILGKKDMIFSELYV